MFCYTGPGGGIAEGCSCADLDGDGDVDLADHSVLQRRLGQPATFEP